MNIAIVTFILGLVAAALSVLKWKELIDLYLVNRNSITWKAMVPAYMFFASISIGLSLVSGSLYLLGSPDPRLTIAAVLSSIP